MKYKIDFIREQFPAFSEPSLKRWAHFENAGGSYMAGAVIERLARFNQQCRVQPYASYPASKEAGEMMDQSYRVLSEILNVPQDWVHIGPSTSASAYTLSGALRTVLKAGENIIVTNQDHEANSGFWRRLEADGVGIREWSIDADGRLNPEALWPLIDEKTRLAAFPHASNILGEINPVKEITDGLRAKNVLSIVDGVSYAPHDWPDLGQLGADIYFFSSYKTYATHQGVMVMDPKLAQSWPNQGHGFNAGDLRKKFNPAGPQHADLAAIAGLEDYVAAVFQKQFKEQAGLGEMARALGALQRKYERKLTAQLFDILAEFKDWKMLGSSDVERRVPTISLYDAENRGHKLAKKLRNHGIMAAGGHFYAPRPLEAMGIDPEHGVLRLSFVHYTSEKEIAKLGKALKKLHG